MSTTCQPKPVGKLKRCVFYHWIFLVKLATATKASFIKDLFAFFGHATKWQVGLPQLSTEGQKALSIYRPELQSRDGEAKRVLPMLIKRTRPEICR